jgi:hypothetical protein
MHGSPNRDRPSGDRFNGTYVPVGQPSTASGTDIAAGLRRWANKNQVSASEPVIDRQPLLPRTTEQRRHNMSRIRGKVTKPEMQLRQGLHAAGLRFRLHAARLPGRPDIVFPRHRAVILMHGCFWHGQ